MIEKIHRFFSDPKIRFGYLNKLGFYNGLSDEAFCKKKGALYLGYTPDFDNPRTYNEKINYLKLHVHDPRYAELSDKYEVKRYVERVAGPEYVVPTLGVWADADMIEWDALPKAFVLKCTHDSGSVFVVRDKARADREAIRRKLTRALKFNYYYDSREWPYKEIVPRVIAEELLTCENGAVPDDYKLYVFNGKVKGLLLCSERENKEQGVAFNFYDEKLTPLKVSANRARYLWPAPEIPAQYRQMCEIAEKLAKDIVAVRVDMYLARGHIYVGEMTFYDGGGFQPFEPREFDYIMGEWLEV